MSLEHFEQFSRLYLKYRHSIYNKKSEIGQSTYLIAFSIASFSSNAAFNFCSNDSMVCSLPFNWIFKCVIVSSCASKIAWNIPIFQLSRTDSIHLSHLPYTLPYFPNKLAARPNRKSLWPPANASDDRSPLSNWQTIAILAHDCLRIPFQNYHRKSFSVAMSTPTSVSSTWVYCSIAQSPCTCEVPANSRFGMDSPLVVCTPKSTEFPLFKLYPQSIATLNHLP